MKMTIATGRSRLGPRRDDQHRGEEQIELLFDGERPRVKQRQRLRRHFEVADVRPEEDVRREQEDRHHRAAERLEFTGDENPVRSDRGRSDDEQHRRQQSTGASLPERQIAESPVRNLRRDQTRDQKTRNDEKHVHTHESAAECGDVRVNQHDRQDRDGAKCVDVGSMAGAHRAALGDRNAARLQR